MNKYVFALLVLAVVVSGCSEANKEVVDPITNIGSEIRANEWMDVRLVNLNTGQPFHISDYNAPVFVSFYEPGCESCAQQHTELVAMQDTSFVLVNTDRSQTRDDAVSVNISAPVTIANTEMTDALERTRIAGNQLVLVCPGGSYEVLSGDVLMASQLESMAADCE